MMRKRSNSYGAIVGIAVLVGSLITQVQPGMSKPGDVLNTLSSPGVGAPAQEKRNIGTGDLSYATRTGALQYGYNFVVPPGRLGLQPALGVSYSSQGSLRGGIASGWSMGIPMIELDTSQNQVLSMSSERGAAGLALLETEKDLRFISSMSGGHRLVPVKEKVETGWTAFRSERDDQYIRYERNEAKGIWRARTMDGKTWYFGTGHDGELDSRDTDTASHDPAMHDGIPTSLIFQSGDTTTPRVSPHHQPLTRVVDAFGNTIRYFWEAEFPRNAEQTRFPEELRLHSIRYTENYAANLGSHAKVEFIYDDEEYCSPRPIDGELPIGASLDHRGFFPWYSGRRPLSFVETFARTNNNGSFDRVRRVKLGVENECPSTGGAQRLLTKITLRDPEPSDEEAADPLQAPITFSYGPLERSFESVKDFDLSPFQVPHGLINHALSWGERKRWGADATLERSLLDMDGDGRLDALLSAGGDDCEFIWRRNLGNGAFGPMNTLPFPDEGMLWRGGAQKPGQGEGCSLSARRTTWANIGSTPDVPTDGNGMIGNHVLHRFIDMNRDGRPDLVTSIQYSDCLIMHDVSGIAEMTSIDQVKDSDVSAPGITEVFIEPWDDEITPFGACSDISPINVDSTIDNVCDQNSSSDTCGCAVLDQLAADSLEKRVGPTECADFSEDSSGFNNNRTSEGGAKWNSAASSNTICKSYPLMRNGHYPWKVHYSDVDTDGNLFFGSGERIWSPIPLDPATNESGLANNGGRGLSSANHAVLDVTGDGIIDVITISTLVTATTVNGEFGRHWNVFPGEADPVTGKFVRFAGVPYLWLIPESAKISSSGGRLNEVNPPYYANSLTETTSMLVDTNADGLPDLIHRKADESGYEIALNTGRGFCVNRLGEVDGTVLSGENSIARIGYDNVGTKNIAPGGQATAEWLAMSGEGKKFAGLVDVDGDGLPDYYDAGDGNVKLNPLNCNSDTCTTVKMGSGSGFLETSGGLKHYIPRDIEVDGWEQDSDYWWQKSDFMDLDGDGLDDIATAKEGDIQTWQLRSEGTAAGKPLRLLNAINNGQGLKTDIEYHPYNDAIAMSNTATGKGMPNHIWVATKITTHSAIDTTDYSPAPDSEVTIKYGDPAYTKNHRGQFGFRGFESIQTSRAHDVNATSGFSVSEKRYDYEEDWSGRVSQTLRYVDGFPYGPGSLVSAISSKEWSEYSLFAGASTSFHSVSSKSYNCMDNNGGFMTETACGVSQLSGQQKSEMQLVADVGGGVADVAWVPVSTENFLLVQNEEDSKRSESDVEVFSTPTKYMMYTSEQRSYIREDDGWTLANRGTKRLDGTDTYVRFSGQYGTIDGSLTHWESSVTRDSVGQVTHSQDPQDFGTSFETTTDYSGLRVHPNKVTNEAGHETRITIDHGTGQVTRALGANLLPCGTNRYEGVETTYDKLGRPTEVMRRSCAGDSYHLERVSTAEYQEYYAEYDEDDIPIVQTPAHVIATTILDVDEGRESVTTTYVDGAGRVLQTEFYLGLEKALTVFHYSSAGQLLRHEEINPSTDPNDSSEFTETVYRYDSLGRAVDMRQGSNAGIGVDVSYGYSDGVSTQTTIEIVSASGPAGGPAGEKIVHADHFGRMIRVEEKMDAGYASTFYEYDGNDNVAVITDPAGVVTEMFHDMAGRRVKVIRGEREWTYAYNKNGNMVKETSPNDLGESADIPGAGLYTTSTAYDELDRPTSRILAVNDLSIDQQKMYEANIAEFVYDDCVNGIGKLCSNTIGKSLTKEYIYDWAGRVLEERQETMLREMVVDFGDADTSPDFTMSRSSYFAYNTSGALTDAWMADGVDQDSSTHLQYAYNRFTGAPETLSLLGTDSRGNPTVEEIALVTRNLAQRVVSQRTGCLIREWDYDYLGRVTDTVVKGAGCTTQNGPILSERMEYFDSSEVSQHEVYRAGLPMHTFNYKYDSQHQLIEADDSEDADNYRVAFNYSPSGNGTMDSVTGINGVLLGRDPMLYTYGDGTLSGSSTSLGADKHAPVTLAGFTKDLHYSYDFAGNVTQRAEITDPTGSPTQDEWSFSYDGISQQREVQLNNGTGGRELYYYDNGGQRYMAVTFANATDRFPERIRVWIGGAEIWYRPNGTGDGMEVDTAYAYLALGGINIGRVKSEGPVVSTEATFANGLSHVMGSVDWDTGVVNAAYVYGPYGEIVDSVGAEQDDHLRRFNGKEADQLSKLSYYGYRYYDKQSLSWTQADPLYLFVPDTGMDEPRRMSLYTFSLNNPIRYVDPDGRDAISDDMLTLGQAPADLDPSGCAGVTGIPDDQICQGSYTDDDGNTRIYTTRKPKDLESCDGPECSPSGTTDEVEVAIFEGLTAWGIFPAITVKVTPDQAKQIEGAGILAMVFGGAIAAVKTAGTKVAKGFVKWAKTLKKTKKKVGTYRPTRKLPRDQHGQPIPDTNAPHTQLGTKSGRNGDYTQGREFDADGHVVRDIDFTDHGRAHPNPHQHRYVDNPTGGTRQRSGPEPIQ